MAGIFKKNQKPRGVESKSNKIMAAVNNFYKMAPIPREMDDRHTFYLYKRTILMSYDIFIQF